MVVHAAWPRRMACNSEGEEHVLTGGEGVKDGPPGVGPAVCDRPGTVL